MICSQNLARIRAQAHKVHSFKLSRDLMLVEKVRDVWGSRSSLKARQYVLVAIAYYTRRLDDRYRLGGDQSIRQASENEAPASGTLASNILRSCCKGGGSGLRPGVPSSSQPLKLRDRQKQTQFREHDCSNRRGPKMITKINRHTNGLHTPGSRDQSLWA
jgi:hypothetical protein